MVHILNFRFCEKCKTVRIAGVTMSQVWNYYEQGRAEDGCKLGKCRTCENIMRCLILSCYQLPASTLYLITIFSDIFKEYPCVTSLLAIQDSTKGTFTKELQKL